MPPKAKAGSAPPPEPTAEAPVVDGPPPPPEEKVDGKQLWLATDALQKSKAMRNYFQLERDKITSFWEISKRELEATKAELRQKERERAEMTERHHIETKVYKQKMRHVLYEHQVQIAQMKMEAERTLKNKQEEHRQKESELHDDNRSLKLLQREQELLHRDVASTLVEKNDRAITDQQRDFERQQKEMHLKYEKKIKTLREDMERQRKDEISIIERRKEDHINELREMHDKAFQEIKDYYNEITSNNLETIRTLKDEVYSRKRTEAHNEKAMFDIAQTNKRLTEPLTKAQKQKKQLEQELSSYARDRAALKTAKQELRQLEQKLKTLMWEHEVLGQRYGKLDEDRDLIFSKYNSMLQEIQQKAVFKRVLVHRKIEVVNSQLERKDAQLSEILKQANVDPAAIQGVERRVDELIGEKNQTIEELQQLLAALTQRHERVSSSYETYLRQNGVPGLQATTHS
jgi:growth arrest-specific protein 8